jgi:hypothetical protein
MQPPQIAKGLRYVFDRCDEGVRPGDLAIADELSLHIC